MNAQEIKDDEEVRRSVFGGCDRCGAALTVEYHTVSAYTPDPHIEQTEDIYCPECGWQSPKHEQEIPF
jgi:predicted RNA-binding Zn-ribbon protein involved in translation (DUF1610 family)